VGKEDQKRVGHKKRQAEATHEFEFWTAGEEFVVKTRLSWCTKGGALRVDVEVSSRASFSTLLLSKRNL
jgi:hypothetical protein